MKKISVNRIFYYLRNKLTLALVIYGIIGSSTPDEFGIAEALIGLLLIWYCLERLSISKLFISFKFYALIFLISYPLLIAIIFENDFVNIFRDLIPFLFLFFSFIFAYNKKVLHEENSIVFGLCFAGTLFAIRHLMSIASEIDDFGTRSLLGSMNYYIMDPAVLFSSILGFSYAFTLSGFNFARLIFFFMTMITSIGIFSMLLRGQIALLVLNLFASYLQKPILLLLFFLTLLVCFGIYLPPGIGEYFNILLSKTSETGFLNSRDKEFLDVFRLFIQEPILFFTGLGWGGVFDTVASGGEVRYTHNSFLYFFLKGGIFALVTFLFLIHNSLFRLSFKSVLRSHLLRACYLVLIFNFLLEPGFKMLTMGVLLHIINMQVVKKK